MVITLVYDFFPTFLIEKTAMTMVLLPPEIIHYIYMFLPRAYSPHHQQHNDMYYEDEQVL